MERNSGADTAGGCSAGLGGSASDQQVQVPFGATPENQAAAMDADLQGTAMAAAAVAAAAGGGPVPLDLPDSASEAAAADAAADDDEDDAHMFDDGEGLEDPMPADAAAALAAVVRASDGAVDLAQLLDLLQEAADEQAEAAEEEAGAQAMAAFWQRAGAVLNQVAALKHWRRHLKARVRQLRQQQLNYLQQQLAQPPLAPALAMKYRVSVAYPDAAAAEAAAAAAALVARTHALSVEYAAYKQQEAIVEGEMAQLVEDLRVELDIIVENIDLVEQHPELLDAAYPALADLEPAALMNALNAVLGLDAAAANGLLGQL